MMTWYDFFLRRVIPETDLLGPRTSGCKTAPRRQGMEFRGLAFDGVKAFVFAVQAGDGVYQGHGIRVSG